MTPQDTHNDSLCVYYDFLEDSGYDTSELRKFDSVKHWEYHYYYGRFDCDKVGVFYSNYNNFVGTHEFHVGNSPGEDSIIEVAGGKLHDVGSTPVYDGVGN